MRSAERGSSKAAGGRESERGVCVAVIILRPGGEMDVTSGILINNGRGNNGIGGREILITYPCPTPHARISHAQHLSSFDRPAISSRKQTRVSENTLDLPMKDSAFSSTPYMYYDDPLQHAAPYLKQLPISPLT